MTHKPLIICIETSTHVCSIALSQDGKTIALRETDDFRSHTDRITVFIQECLEEVNLIINDIDAVALSGGPGSYTGLRIGASTAKGLCYGLGIPLIAVPSCDILIAEGSGKDHELVLAAIDARREEIYGKLVGPEGVLINVCPIILNESSLLNDHLQGRNFSVLGSGAEKVKGYYGQRTKVVSNTTSASYMSAIAKDYFNNQQFSDISSYSPFYLKNPNITLRRKKLL